MAEMTEFDILANPVLAAEINALPERIRRYIHHCETDADPAGDKWQLLVAQENVAALSREIERLRAELAHKDAYYAQFNLTPKPKCDICDDTGSMSDGTACVHLTEQPRAGCPE